MILGGALYARNGELKGVMLNGHLLLQALHCRLFELQGSIGEISQYS